MGASTQAPQGETRADMLVLRFMGSLFLLGAVIALTADLSRARQPGTAPFASLHKHWSDLAPQSLANAQKTVQSRTHALVWDPLIPTPLAVPAFITFGCFAVGLLYLGRPKRRVEIFVN